MGVSDGELDRDTVTVFDARGVELVDGLGVIDSEGDTVSVLLSDEVSEKDSWRGSDTLGEGKGNDPTELVDVALKVGVGAG